MKKLTVSGKKVGKKDAAKKVVFASHECGGFSLKNAVGFRQAQF